MINRLTGFYAKGDAHSANRHFQGLFLLMVAIALMGIMGSVLFLPEIDWRKLFKIHTVLAGAEINSTVLAAFSIFFLQLPLSLIQKIPYTFQAGYISEVHLLAANAVGAMLIIFGLHLHAGLVFFVIALNAATILAPSTILIHLLSSGYLNLQFHGFSEYFEEMALVKTTTGHFFVLQVCGTLMLATPFALITYYHGAEAVAVFGILLQVLVAVQTPFTVMLQPMWAKMVELKVNKNIPEIRTILTYYLRLSAGYSFFVIFFFTVVLQPLFNLVLKHPIHPSLPLKLSFGLWCILGLIGGGGVYAAMLALDLVNKISRLSVLQLLVFLILALVVIPTHGSLGAALCIIASYFVTLPVILLLITRRLFDPPEMGANVA